MAKNKSEHRQTSCRFNSNSVFHSISHFRVECIASERTIELEQLKPWNDFRTGHNKLVQNWWNWVGRKSCFKHLIHQISECWVPVRFLGKMFRFQLSSIFRTQCTIHSIGFKSKFMSNGNLLLVKRFSGIYIRKTFDRMCVEKLVHSGYNNCTVNSFSFVYRRKVKALSQKSTGVVGISLFSFSTIIAIMRMDNDTKWKHSNETMTSSIETKQNKNNKNAKIIHQIGMIFILCLQLLVLLVYFSFGLKQLFVYQIWQLINSRVSALNTHSMRRLFGKMLSRTRERISCERSQQQTWIFWHCNANIPFGTIYRRFVLFCVEIGILKCSRVACICAHSV